MSTPTETNSKHAQIAFDCLETIYRFTAHFDAGEYVDMEAFLAPDGVWKRPDGDIVGPAQMRHRLAALSNDWIMRHVITNPRVSIVSSDRVNVDSYFTVYMHTFGTEPPVSPAPLSGPLSVGRYHDELVRIDGVWKIALRHPTHDIKRA